jgi:hypothetical protein
VRIRKFFLSVSRKEQKRRFLERIETPEKNWKFSALDVRERGFWKQYMAAYEEAIREVSAAIVDALGSLGLRYPEIGPEARRELAAAKRALLAER